MRIAIFHNLAPGGAKRTVYEEIKRLSKNHTVDLYQFKTKDKDFLDFSSLSCGIFEYDFGLGDGSRLVKDYRNFISLKLMQKKMAQDINKKNYHVCIVHPDRYTQSPFILRFLKPKKVYYAQETLRIVYEKQFAFSQDVNLLKKTYEHVSRSVRKSIDATNINYADVILTNSHFTKENIEKAYKREAHVCYLGVDTNTFTPYKEKRINVVFVGGTTFDNGYPLLEEAKKNIDFDIKVRVISMNASKKYSDEALSKEYSRAVATLCLSVNEPFGLVALESMACQTPVIAVNEGGYKETVLDKKAGFLIGRNPKELAGKIMLLSKDKQLTKKMGEMGRNYVKESWSWKKHVKDLLKYL